jgi:hypothetical protein
VDRRWRVPLGQGGRRSLKKIRGLQAGRSGTVNRGPFAGTRSPLKPLRALCFEHASQIGSRIPSDSMVWRSLCRPRTEA